MVEPAKSNATRGDRSVGGALASAGDASTELDTKMEVEMETETETEMEMSRLLHLQLIQSLQWIQSPPCKSSARCHR